MNNKLNVTVLGCGSSAGVPYLCCSCPVCTSDNPKNKRTRVSIAVEAEGKTILVDTPPDMRTQCLREGIAKIDALVYTHAHADHLHGIDDTRSFNHAINAPIDTYLDEDTLHKIQECFAYVLMPPKRAAMAGDWGWYRPCLNPIAITPFAPFSIGKVQVMPLAQQHGGGKSLGLRIGNFAYSTDVNFMPEETFRALEGIDTWIVDCLRYELAPTHAHLEMALGWIERIRPRRAYLTHLSHAFDYDKLSGELPDGVFPAYDGLKLEVA